MAASLLLQYPNSVRKHWHNQIVAANTDTQIFQVAWTVPANAVAYLEKLVISNQNTVAGIVKFYDGDIVSSGNKPPARGSMTSPIIPPLNIGPGAQVTLGYDSCPNPDLTAGLVGQSTVGGAGADASATGAMYVYAQWIELEN